MIKPVLIAEEGYHRCWFILLEPRQRPVEVSNCMYTYVDSKTDADHDREKSVFLFLHLIV